MHKIWENRPEDLRVDGPGENTRYALSLRRGGGWGENCYQGCQDLNFTRTSKIIKLQAALKTDGQVLHVGMTSAFVRVFLSGYSELIDYERITSY